MEEEEKRPPPSNNLPNEEAADGVEKVETALLDKVIAARLLPESTAEGAISPVEELPKVGGAGTLGNGRGELRPSRKRGRSPEKGEIASAPLAVRRKRDASG